MAAGNGTDTFSHSRWIPVATYDRVLGVQFVDVDGGPARLVLDPPEVGDARLGALERLDGAVTVRRLLGDHDTVPSTGAEPAY